MKLMSVMKLFIVGALSFSVSVSSADDRNREGLSDFFDIVGGMIEAGRGDDGHHSDHARGRVVKSVDIRAEKLGSRMETIDVRQPVSYIRLTALKNRVDIRSDLEVVSDNRWPMSYQVHDLREGESRTIRLNGGFFDGIIGGNSGRSVYVDYVRLEVESPNIIGSRGVLRVEFIR